MSEGSFGLFLVAVAAALVITLAGADWFYAGFVAGIITASLLSRR